MAYILQANSVLSRTGKIGRANREISGRKQATRCPAAGGLCSALIWAWLSVPGKSGSTLRAEFAGIDRHVREVPGRLRVGKGFLHVAAVVDAAMCPLHVALLSARAEMISRHARRAAADR